MPLSESQRWRRVIATIIASQNHRRPSSIPVFPEVRGSKKQVNGDHHTRYVIKRAKRMARIAPLPQGGKFFDHRPDLLVAKWRHANTANRWIWGQIRQNMSTAEAKSSVKAASTVGLPTVKYELLNAMVLEILCQQNAMEVHGVSQYIIGVSAKIIPSS